MPNPSPRGLDPGPARRTPAACARKLKLAGQVSDLFGALLEAYTREKLNGGKEAEIAVEDGTLRPPAANG